ncbi:peptidase T [Parendozoicomonas haliclonae]|uniref:Peptidase T n=1 Tax=Parendozoicomonas haliclonae TaxID=1960125 RepID=A0A1X7ALW9_9GAMM|nr:peptidase T [Parendozoicomonas haliclonae]SMA48744.1 Peptidase T [Parendozoicomonas haliclonae]
MDIIERFLAYTRINTTTDIAKGQAGIVPSSEGQMELARFVARELEELGLVDIKVRDNAILTATLPANVDYDVPVVSFFGHLDTSAELKTDTNAQITRYEGGDIVLNKELEVILRASEFPEIENYIGQDIIHTDGTSLLGADDKAAIAAILDAILFLKNNPEIKHGPVKVAFVPDEEQGMLGSKAFDTKEFGADFGYTLDCCGIGEFVCENWNAGHAVVTFKGQSAHPMSAKGKLKNSLLMAHKFISMLPGGEAPEYTFEREGYYWVKQMSGNSAQTILNLDIRDFTKSGYLSRKDFLQKLSDSCSLLWGEGSVTIKLVDSYENVSNSLQGDASFPIDIAFEAYRHNGIEPNVIPMRGGYDGSILSQNGLPCPNIFTGAHNFHSVYEYMPVDSLKAASKVVVDIVRITCEREASKN